MCVKSAALTQKRENVMSRDSKWQIHMIYNTIKMLTRHLPNTRGSKHVKPISQSWKLHFVKILSTADLPLSFAKPSG